MILFYLLYKSLSLRDEFCRRVWNFIVACNTSKCSLVQDIANYGILFGRMHSLIGQNAWFLCSLQYKCSMSDIFTEKTVF